MLELFEKRWFRYFIQLVSLVFIYLAYFFIRFLLPKKFRMTDYQLKKVGRGIQIITSNIVSPLDGIGEMLKKAFNVFENFNASWKESSSEPSYLEFLVNQLPDYKVYNLKILLTFIKPLIRQLNTSFVILQEIDAGHTAIKYRFTGQRTGKTVDVVVMQTKGDVSGYGENYIGLSNNVATKNSIAEIMDIFCEALGDNLYLTTNNDNEIVVETLAVNDTSMANYICPEEKYQEITKEIAAFAKRGRQRSYLLVGPPGTGKTSFCIETAKRIGGRVLKLQNDLLTEFGGTTLRTLLEILNAKVIIVDDIDRLSNVDVSELLFAIESVKSFAEMPVLLATVNNIRNLDSAVIRPGRFDEIFKFAEPTKEELGVFIKSYCKKTDIAINEEETEKMIEALEGLTHAYVVEYLEQLHFLKNVDVIVTKIKNRKEFL